MKILNYIIFGILNTAAGFTSWVYIRDLLGLQGLGDGVNSQNVTGLLSNMDFWKVAAILGTVLGLMFAFMRKSLVKLLKPNPLSLFLGTMAAVGIADYLNGGVSGEFITAQLLFTAAASSSTRNPVQFLPQTIVFEVATVPNRIQVSVAGKNDIVNIDSDGITALNTYGKLGAVGNFYALPLADGYDGNQLTEITFDNADANPVPVYGHGFQKASIFVETQQLLILQNSGQRFEDFRAIFIPNADPTDIITLFFKNGTSQEMNIQEFRAISQQFQDGQQIVINNDFAGDMGLMLNAVNYRPVAGNVNAYINFFTPIA